MRQEPELVILNKKHRTCKIIESTMPKDSGVAEKQKEKVDKYQDLAKEKKKMWKVIYIVIGTLATIPKWLGKS